MKKKIFNLKAKLICNNLTQDGLISIMDGLFKPLNKEYFFVRNGSIDFEYDNKSYSFPFSNIGGKYFIQNYKTNPEYQRIANMITLNETLEVQQEKKITPKVKI